MSGSNAAAIRRRVTAPQQSINIKPTPPPAPVQTQVREKPTGLTMQQFISALDKINFEDLKILLYDRIKELHIKRYPYNNFLY